MQPNNQVPASDPRSTLSFSFGRKPQPLTRDIAVEVAINIVYGSVPYVVMMCTPVDLEDFVYGFSYTEGIIDNAHDIRNLYLDEAEEGIVARVTLASDTMQRHLARSRNLIGRTGCGVCGISDLASLPKAQVSETARVSLRLSAVQRAISMMPMQQTLNRQTHAVHAAAWCDASGHVVSIREDVGRHNALDKLIGALLRAGVPPSDGFVSITSRCSYEMVEKVARFGGSALVAVSAPTSLAIDRAVAHDLLLLAIARDDGVIAFTHGDRVENDLLVDVRAGA